MTVNIIEVVQVIPTTDSDSALTSATSLTIPLTFFDLPWLLFSPVQRVFFYKHTESTRDHFHSIIVPNLKHSLSLVLNNYLPLTGRITWNTSDPKPKIIVTQNDSVSTTIAETDSDFSLLSSYGQRPVSELHALLPKLPVSDVSAIALSVQITLFPNAGFSIGVVAHHAVLDGKSSTMFIKAWARICKEQLQNGTLISLPENLTPSYDRSSIQDLTKLDEQVIELVRSLKRDKASKSLTPFLAREIDNDVVLATLVLSRDDIKSLRERFTSEDQDGLHLSTFVIAYAYVWTCFVKARGGNGERLVSIIFVGDFRERLDPPLPATYFGNCMITLGSYNRKAAEFVDEKGFVTAVEILSDLVKGMSSRTVETVPKGYIDSFACLEECSQLGTVAGSTRLGVYESDFGWGRPVKVDVVSIDQGEAISMAERRDESGGVEIGMCLKKTEMDSVISIFNSGLQR